MPRFRVAPGLALALLAASPAFAQGPQGQPVYSGAPGAPPLTTPTLPQAAAPTTMSVPQNTTPPQPAAAQPTLPGAPQGSPVVEQIVGKPKPALTVRKEARRRVLRKPRRLARDRGRVLDRPALAGVELVAPLPPPEEPPHFTVPVPAYPLESFAAAFTTPPPPIVCHPTRRDRDAPDPHLYRESPVECEPDNP